MRTTHKNGLADAPDDRLDKDLAAKAYEKLRSGHTPTAVETAALKRYERARQESLRWQYYNSIPQKHWRQMSGRQTKVLQEQAERYGLPFGGPQVNLPQVVRALHDFLAAHAHQLAATDDELMHTDGASSPALERYREERAAIARLDRLEREGTLLPRERMREGLARIASVLRGAGESLQRHYGPGAAEILNEALSDSVREIDRLFGQGEPSDAK